MKDTYILEKVGTFLLTKDFFIKYLIQQYTICILIVIEVTLFKNPFPSLCFLDLYLSYQSLYRLLRTTEIHLQ